MNNKEVLEVIGVIFIGVILILAITIAISATVYLLEKNNLYKDFSGQIIDKFRLGLQKPYYFITLENETLNIIKDIEVNETVFHLYNIGNYYDCNNIRR